MKNKAKISYNSSDEEDSYFFCNKCGHRFEDDEINDNLNSCPECKSIIIN